MAIAAVDECVRNLVCVGADPSRIAILDNFCWPSCNDPRNMGSLVRAAEGCYDAAKAYGVPFISGKDSLNNQFRTEEGDLIEIPPTLLISGVAIVPDVSKCVTMDLKGDSSIYLVEPVTTLPRDTSLVAQLVADLIRQRLVRAAHDCSEGGWLVALAEMAIAAADSPRTIGAHTIPIEGDAHDSCFVESRGRYLLEIANDHRSAAEQVMSRASWTLIAHTDEIESLRVQRAGDPDSDPAMDLHVSDLRAAFLGTLDW